MIVALPRDVLELIFPLFSCAIGQDPQPLHPAGPPKNEHIEPQIHSTLKEEMASSCAWGGFRLDMRKDFFME